METMNRPVQKLTALGPICRYIGGLHVGIVENVCNAAINND